MVGHAQRYADHAAHGGGRRRRRAKIIRKGKALVGRAGTLIKDETLSLMVDAKEAKAPIKEGVGTFIKGVPLRQIKAVAGKLTPDSASGTASEERAEREPPAEGNREYFRRIIEETNERASGKASRA
jgi:hypothetical protein